MLTLDPALCRERQAVFAERLRGQNIHAALITEPMHLLYFFGLGGWGTAPAAAMIGGTGATLLSHPAGSTPLCAADESLSYETAYLLTQRDNRHSLALAPILGRLGNGRIGVDAMPAPWLLPSASWVPMGDEIASLRRRKDSDELALIEAAIAATEAGYTAALGVLRPGLLETELYAAFYCAAVVASGGSLPELASDFRGGEVGGRPRPVPLVDGDLVPIDAGAVVGGYNADLCRTFAVNLRPTEEQQDAFAHVDASLAVAEAMIGPGTPCRDVYRVIHDYLDGYRGWSFYGHLGHGIGLAPHEAPRINPHWDEVFAEGDVFTLEPGLYAAELRAGVRLEENYLVTSTGVRRLSSFPRALIR